jgi:hypothetical protein
MGWRWGIRNFALGSLFVVSDNEPAAECSPGPAQRNEVERSAAWVIVRHIFQARFSGRQILSPAQAGLIMYGAANPGFRSLRSLHPGLHYAASFAGSLSS